MNPDKLPSGSRGVVLPALNECESLKALLPMLLPIVDELVIVDDGQDDLEQMLRLITPGAEKIRHIRGDGQGLAAAIKKGLLSSKTDIVGVMDADGSHSASRLNDLYLALSSDPNDQSIYVGSRYTNRYIPHSLQQLLSWAGNIFVTKLLGLLVRECTSGFFVTQRSNLMPLLELDLWRGYGDYFMELLYETRRRGWNIREVPTVHESRIAGLSKTKLIKYTWQFFCRAWKIYVRNKKRSADPL